MARYRTLILGLTKSNPQLRLLLIDGTIIPAKFAKMTDIELASDEFVKELKEKEAYQMASKRSDAILEYQNEMGADSEMYSCIQCGAKKVRLKQL